MKYSFSQLEGLWIDAGGSPKLAPLMAAIAMAESRGDSDAYNKSGATGLWQILGAVNPRDQARLRDPKVNAHEAVLKYRSQGLKAWEAYTNGSYKQFMRGHPPPPGHIGTTSFPGSGIAGSILGHLINPDMIQRLGLIIFGAFLIIVGVMLLAGGRTFELVTDATKPKKERNNELA